MTDATDQLTKDLEWAGKPELPDVPEAEILRQQADKRIEEKRQAYYELCESEKPDPAELMKRFEEYEEAKKQKWIFVDLPYIQEKLPPRVLAVALREALVGRIEQIVTFREKIYGAYEEMRKAGVPFQERRKKLDVAKIALLDEEEKKLGELLRSMVPRPLEDWLIPGDLERIRRMGVRNFIKTFFRIAIWQRNQNGQLQ